MNYRHGSDGSFETEIYLNIYDLNPAMNASCINIGLGFYHTGLQIGGSQYTFGFHEGPETGVMEVPPKVNHPNFRESILLGKTTASSSKIHSIIDSLKPKFPGNSYHLIRKNCNTFTNCLCEAILHKGIPGYVNRMANMGKFFMQIGDFFAMTAYNQKYQVSAKALGVQLEKHVFDKQGQGVMIG